MTGHGGWTEPDLTRREAIGTVAGACAVVAASCLAGRLGGLAGAFGPTEALAESLDDLPQTITVTGERGVYRDAGVNSQADDGLPYMSAMKVVGSNVPVYCLARNDNHSSPRPDENIVFTKQAPDTGHDAAVCGYLLSYGYPAMPTVQGVTGQQARYVTQAALWMTPYTSNYWSRTGLDTASASSETRSKGLVDKAHAFLNQAEAAVNAGWKGGVALYTNSSTPGGTHTSAHWQDMVMAFTTPPKGHAKLQKSTVRTW